MSFKHRRQAGFNLIELMIVLAIIGILGALLMLNYSGAKTTAKALFTDMSTISKNAMRVKIDTGCYPINPNLLITVTDASNTADNSCGKDLTNSYQGPYMQMMPLRASGNVNEDKLAEGVDISLPTYITSGTQRLWVVEATNLPSDVAKEFIALCNGSLDETGPMQGDTALTKFRCAYYGTIDTDGVQVNYLYDQTR